MTVTESPTEASPHIDEHHGDDASPSGGDGLFRLVTSNDHKDVGRLWIGTSLFFFVLVSLLGIAVEFERVALDPDIFGSVSRAFQAWTLFRTAAIFMVVIPMFIGLATVITPLQVGSASIAFPRLAAAAFWAWLFASIIHVVSFVADGGLGPAQTTSVQSTLLTMSSLGFMILALLGASICIATTVVALRPTGMTLIEVPAFSWSMLVATSIWLISLPVIVSSLILGYVDLQGQPFLDLGNPELLWSRVEWAWSQPQIFAYAIPVLGILADIIPVQTNTRQANRPVLMGLIGAFGAFSFGAWAQSAWSKGSDEAFVDGNLIYEEFLYLAFGLVIFLPAFGAFSGAMDQIRRGKVPKPGAALIGSVFGALALLGAIVVGEVRVLGSLLELIGLEPGFNALHEDGVLVSSSTGILILVVAASMASAAGAFVHWAPKIFGGYAVDPLGALAAMALFGGGLTAGVANLLSGLDGQPDDIRLVTDVDGLISTMNLMSTVGVAMIAGGALATIGAVLGAGRSKEIIPDDPWGGQTLEWAAPSPPPAGNFVEPIGVVRSAQPLLDEIEEVG